MTELQMGLIALGSVAVLGIFTYNKWQERQHRQMAERVLLQPGEDILLNPDAGDNLAAGTEKEPQERQEPALQENAAWDEPQEDQEDHHEEEVVAESIPPLSADLLSPGVDAIAVLELVEPVPATQLLDFQSEVFSPLRKPVHWVGFNKNQGCWELIHAETRTSYRSLRVGLQMANRQGPVSAADLSLFSGGMERLADELMAMVDMPSTQQVLDQASQLDRFCADVDMQIGVNVVSQGTPFAGTKIRALAEAAGMTLGNDGVYARDNDRGNTLFSMQNFETSLFSPESLKTLSTHGLVFLLDVPRAHEGAKVYNQMLSVAKSFAESLGGILVDDNRLPLAEPQLAHILQEYVVKPQEAMEAHGVPPGSSLAVRLFA